MTAIAVHDLAKHYRVHEREGGLAGSLKAFFRRKYRNVKAVDGISFAIAPGEIVGFLGPNGAGKTTTLKMLAGLLHPTSGALSVLGFTPKERRREFLSSIAMVLGQKQQLAWDLPPEDTFLLNKEIYAVSDADYAQRFRALDDLLQLGDLIKRQTRRLSLGERMKCELTAALLHGPKVLFLDEPTIGLDVNMQEAVRDFIAAYNKTTGATVLLTSHYMADVTALCKRIIVITEGKIVFDGDLSSVLDTMGLDKRVTLHFSKPVARETLARYGEVASADSREAALNVPRAEIAAAASRMLSELPIADIAIADTPIETVIGKLMTGARP